MNVQALLAVISKFVDANKLGGWVRAGVAAGFVALIARYPILGNYIDPAVQTEIAAAVAATIVGIWSQATKTDAAKIAAVAALPDVAKIEVKPTATNGVAAAAANPALSKVVMTQ